MFRFVKILCGLMLIALPGASGQTSSIYPYQTMIGRDTVVVIHIRQVRLLNVHFSRMDECRETNKELEKAFEALMQADKAQNKVVVDLKFEVADLRAALTKQDRVINLQQKQVKAEKRKRTIAFMAAIVLGGIAIIK